MTIIQVHNKLFSSLTRFLLKRHYLQILHVSLLKYSFYWHPYVDKSSNHDEIFLLLKKLKSTSLQLTATGVLQVYSVNDVYMIPFGKLSRESLSKNYSNWLIIKSSAYFELVDYKLDRIKTGTILYYRIDRMNSLSKPYRKQAFTKIKTTLKSKKRAAFLPYIYTDNAINKLNKHCLINFKELLAPLLENKKQAYIGAIHGDLTAQNILIKNNGKVVLIDLDRFTMKAPQFIDELHFFVNLRSSEDRISWLIILPKMLRENNWGKEEIIGYFLYRINSEIREDVHPTKNYLKLVSTSARAIISFMEERYDEKTPK